MHSNQHLAALLSIYYKYGYILNYRGRDISIYYKYGYILNYRGRDISIYYKYGYILNYRGRDISIYYKYGYVTELQRERIYLMTDILLLPVPAYKIAPACKLNWFKVV